jgi:hypothetical protein
LMAESSETGKIILRRKSPTTEKGETV